MPPSICWKCREGLKITILTKILVAQPGPFSGPPSPGDFMLYANKAFWSFFGGFASGLIKEAKENRTSSVKLILIPTTDCGSKRVVTCLDTLQIEMLTFQGIFTCMYIKYISWLNNIFVKYLGVLTVYDFQFSTLNYWIILNKKMALPFLNGWYLNIR